MCVLPCAGIKLQPGIYNIMNPCEHSHISLDGNKDEGGKGTRRTPFYIDFSGVTLVQTARPFQTQFLQSGANSCHMTSILLVQPPPLAQADILRPCQQLFMSVTKGVMMWPWVFCSPILIYPSRDKFSLLATKSEGQCCAVACLILLPIGQQKQPAVLNRAI